MFSIGENFKEVVQLVSRNATNAMLSVSEIDIVDVGNSTDSFFIVVTSGTIYIEACGTHSLQIYVNLIINMRTHSLQIYVNLIINMRKLGTKFAGISISLTTKGPQEIYSGRSHFLINDFAIAINYRHNQSLTPAVHSVIKAHSQGDNRRANWEDLSVHVGGNAINAECGLDSRKLQIDMIVSSKKVVASLDDALHGSEDQSPSKIQSRICFNCRWHWHLSGCSILPLRTSSNQPLSRFCIIFDLEDKVNFKREGLS